MGRTNIVLDDELVGRVMTQYSLRTKREAVEYALRRLLRDDAQPDEPMADAADWWAAHFEAIRGHPLGE